MALEQCGPSALCLLHELACGANYIDLDRRQWRNTVWQETFQTFYPDEDAISVNSKRSQTNFECKPCHKRSPTF